MLVLDCFLPLWARSNLNVFLQLPHCKLKDSKEKTAVQIADIAAKFFADPNVIPVAVCKAEKSQQTLGDLDSFHTTAL
jgi:hypothetical protein